MADDEVWKKIPGRKGYEASNLGRIRSVDRWIVYKTGQRRFYKGKVLSQFDGGPTGYQVTNLSMKYPAQYIHHLVAKTFLGKPPRKGLDICHDNGDKTDNRLTNLKYGTRSSNMADAVRHRYERAWYEYAQDTQKHIRPRRLESRNR